ncbi:1-acyl-sn-glycerol-3-phosphate acyltransferase 2-like [Rutidosis leptorrhynchoides]|uniref:1-acyl-sn-glycerol-3-phosphate acyltransferase 2-like n=1 Tax=Rutidosis leptorrhynchoides TaxID=125765 RepID=UPI003A99D2C8
MEVAKLKTITASHHFLRSHHPVHTFPPPQIFLINRGGNLHLVIFSQICVYQRPVDPLLITTALAIMKKSSKFLPVIGWSMWFSEYLFLERNFAKDESTIKVGLQQLKEYPQPFWLGLFVEGTRFTQAKLLVAQEYASSHGLPVPRNVLIPRTKGFVTSVSQTRSFIPAIYDMTVAIPKNSPPPTMLRLFKGQSSVVHLRMKRHLMKDLPETDEAVAKWCKDLFVAKDDLLDKHKEADVFPDSEVHDIGRPIKSLVVVTSWACLLIFWTFKFFQWSNLLSSWKGLTITTVCLSIVTVLMQILIQFSQSERSTPANVGPSRTSNGEESSHILLDKQQ